MLSSSSNFHLLFLVCISCLSSVSAIGSSIFECPKGHYLSGFDSAFGGFYRFYQFQCNKFVDFREMDESCTTTEIQSTENGDLYLSCLDYQYTSGVEIIDDKRKKAWRLLCCSSNSVEISNKKCTTTKFLNDFHKHFIFSSNGRMIRKWQSFDRRWWLQICSVEIIATKIVDNGNSQFEKRSVRSVPKNWRESRFGIPTIEGYSIKRNRIRIIPTRIGHYPNYRWKNPHSFANIDHHQINIVTTTRKTIIQHEKIRQNNGKQTIRNRQLTDKLDNSRPISTLDYYDIYDDDFDKEEFLDRDSNPLFEVSELIENLKNGLTLAQFAIPNSKDFRTKKRKNGEINSEILPPISFSRDGLKSEEKNIGAIESMLQFLGLCKGH